MINNIKEENISRTVESVLSIIGGVTGIIIGIIFIGSAINSFFDYYYISPDYWLLLLGVISCTGGVIGVVSGAIFKRHVKIASILALIASVSCLIGGIFLFGMVGFVLLLIAGILGFVDRD